ncbi:hypothetical protein D3C75_1138410 [compost metagenome]
MPSFFSCSSKRVLLRPLSSATSTGWVLKRGSGNTASPSGDDSFRLSVLSSAISNRKVEPRPGALSTVIVPPISSTMDLHIDKPSPVPSPAIANSLLICE